MAKIVVLEGDETGQELLQQAVRVLDSELLGVELELERYDLSLENRRRTENEVVLEAARAIYDVPIAPDPQFTNLLNDGNKSKLNGWLQVEVICQAPIHADVPDSYRACATYTGKVTVPPVGAHIQATGAYTLDHDHGWMEIHPASVITIR